MHDSLRVYDACLAMIAMETEALENEDEERLLELSQNRAALMNEAWGKRAGCSSALLLERLEAIRKAQRTLEEKTEQRTETLRIALKSTSKESTRLAGYGRALGDGMNLSLLYKSG